MTVSAATPPSDCPVVKVRLLPGGHGFTASPDLPLLTAAEAAGWVLPSSCRNGTCRTCICRLVAGRVTYRIDWPGLSAEEKTGGWILPCVAHPAGDRDIVLHQPAARRAGSVC